MNNRIAQTKKYVKEHAPELVAAVATTIMLGLAINVRKVAYREIEVRHGWRDSINACQEIDKPFTYYPGVGVYGEKPKK